MNSAAETPGAGTADPMRVDAEASPTGRHRHVAHENLRSRLSGSKRRPRGGGGIEFTVCLTTCSSSGTGRPSALR